MVELPVERLCRTNTIRFCSTKSTEFKVNGLTERQHLEKPSTGSSKDEPGRCFADTVLRDVIEGAPLIVDKDGTVAKCNIRLVLNLSSERLGYATQKPEGLLTLLLKGASAAGDLVADFFCGSDTTMAVAEKLGRRWIGCDLERWAIHTTRKRLLGIESCQTFEVLNLDKYECQYWQGVTFGDSRDKPLTERALYEYLAFVLKLYGAAPVLGLEHLHGRKGKALVHIGAVDAPVTISQIGVAIKECAQLKQDELHVLGWEWEMGLYYLMVEEARKKGVKLLLLQILREVMEQQAAAKADVRFFEPAYLEA